MGLRYAGFDHSSFVRRYAQFVYHDFLVYHDMDSLLVSDSVCVAKCPSFLKMISSSKKKDSKIPRVLNFSRPFGGMIPPLIQKTYPIVP